MNNSKQILIVLACLLPLFISVFVFSCNPKITVSPTTTTSSSNLPVAVDEWYLPLLVPLSGPSAVHGLKAAWSAKYAVETINDAGGVRGVPINLVPYDAPGDPGKAVINVSEILANTPLLLLGPIDQIGMGAVIGMIAKEGLPLNGFFSTVEEQMQYAPLGTHMMPDDVNAGRVGCKEWIKLHPDIKSVAVFYYPGLSEETANGAKQGLEESGVKVYMIDINFGQDIDMGPIVTRVMGLNVDGYYSSWFGMDFVNILKALSDRGMDEGWRVMAGGQAMGPDIFTSGANYNEDIYFWELFDLINTGNAEFQDYVSAYGADHDGGFPYTWANWGFYYGVKAFKAAVEAKNITGDPAKLVEERAAIRDFFWNAKDIPSFGSDTFSYGDNGRIVNPLYVYQVNDNQLTIVAKVE